MNDDLFWKIIDMFDWNSEDVTRSAVNFLSELDIKAIEGFDELLAKKLYALDTKTHAKHIGEGSFVEGEYFSDDWFLYVRCAAVANGKDFYEYALKNPEDMPKDIDYEDLLYIAGNAYRMKTGKEFEFSASVSYETASNLDGWE